MGVAIEPTVLTATEASRGFAAVLERANRGESFVVTKNGAPVARIMPPAAEPNGQAFRDILSGWGGDDAGFTDDVLDAMNALFGPQERDQERLAWADDLR